MPTELPQHLRMELIIRLRNYESFKVARLYASTMFQLNYSIFWVITQREVVLNRRFGTTYRPDLE